MDIKKSLSNIVFFDVRQDLMNLASAEREALHHCVRAAEIMIDLYLAQMDPENTTRRAALKQCMDDEGKDLLKYFEVTIGPYEVYADGSRGTARLFSQKRASH